MAVGHADSDIDTDMYTDTSHLNNSSQPIARIVNGLAIRITGGATEQARKRK